MKKANRAAQAVGNKIWGTIIVITLFLTAVFCQPAQAADQKVIHILIKGDINSGQAALVRRALLEADSKNAQAILVEIDTFGGLVDSAVSIRDLVSGSKVPTICYINNRAWSAGALIAIAHKHIAITPGGSIGAAEPIPTTEKTVAALKAEFAATANKSGRNPKVAEAMVDKSLGFPGYAEAGQILALTDYQAIEVGYADIVAEDINAVLEHFGYGGAELIEYTPGWLEKTAGWLSDPAIKSLLLSIIILAVLAEVKSAGTGVAAMIGVAAALLFFGSQWLTGLAGWLELFLFLGGIAMIVFEIISPTTGLFGLFGVISIMASFFLTLGADTAALSTMSLSIAVAIVAFLFIMKRLPTSRLWLRFVLKETQTNDVGYVSSQSYEHYLGRTGIALTLLRPAGTAQIDGVYLDVVSEGQFIETGKTIKVVSVNGNRILVRLVEDSN